MFIDRGLSANAKLTDDEERAKGVRIGEWGLPRSPSFGRATGSVRIRLSFGFVRVSRHGKVYDVEPGKDTCEDRP